MRVLMITQYYPPETGAAAIRLQAMVRQMIGRGVDVDVVTALPNYPAGKIFPEYRGTPYRVEQRDGATVRRVWIHAATGSGLGRLFGYVSFTVSSLVGMLRSPKPDVVVVESPPLPAVIPALLYCRVRRRPYVLLVADLWPDTAVELELIRRGGLVFRALARLERLAYRRAWLVSPVTYAQVETLATEKGVAREKIAHLPNGVDTELFVPGDDDGDRDATRTIVFAGNLGYAQGLDVILDAAAILGGRRDDVRFLFVGAGSERARLERRVEDEGLANVGFRDPVPVDEIASVMRDCYAGITSLRSSPVLEGARPSKIFPVMASGRPVVYSGRGEGAQLVLDVGAGVVAEPEDPEALVVAIEGLLEDPEEARAMGRRGREFVVEHLSWDRLVEGWLDELARARVPV